MVFSSFSMVFSLKKKIKLDFLKRFTTFLTYFENQLKKKIQFQFNSSIQFSVEEFQFFQFIIISFHILKNNYGKKI